MGQLDKTNFVCTMASLNNKSMNRILAALAPIAVALPTIANAGELKWNDRDTKTTEAIARVFEQCAAPESYRPLVEEEKPGAPLSYGEPTDRPSKYASGFSMSKLPDEEGNVQYTFEVRNPTRWEINANGEGATGVENTWPTYLDRQEVDCVMRSMPAELPKGTTFVSLASRADYYAQGGFWLGGAPVGNHDVVVNDPKRKKQAARQLAKKD